jgi:hyaluronan synthase
LTVMRNAAPTLSSLNRPECSKPLLPRQNRFYRLDLWLKALFPLLFTGLVILAFKLGSFDAYLNLLNRQSYTAFLPALGAGYALAMVLFQVMRTIFWGCYKPYPRYDGRLPNLTIIVPAFNEGTMVETCLDSVATADYPRDRLEIICIDDGSTDDTWSYLARARERHPDLIKTIRFPHNQGKKEALYAG